MVLELEKLYALRADLVLVLVMDSIRAIFDVSRRLRFVNPLGNMCSLG